VRASKFLSSLHNPHRERLELTNYNFFLFRIFTWAQNLVGVSLLHNFFKLLVVYCILKTALKNQVSNQIAWLCIGVSSTRFRSAWKSQGKSPTELRFKNPVGRFAGPIVTVVVTFIILVQGWSVFSGGFDKIGFVSNYSMFLLLLSRLFVCFDELIISQR
jgi:hypothetical protein